MVTIKLFFRLTELYGKISRTGTGGGRRPLKFVDRPQHFAGVGFGQIDKFAVSYHNFERDSGKVGIAGIKKLVIEVAGAVCNQTPFFHGTSSSVIGRPDAGGIAHDRAYKFMIPRTAEKSKGKGGKVKDCNRAALL